MNSSRKIFALSFILMFFMLSCSQNKTSQYSENDASAHWRGIRAAYLGDSMTQLPRDSSKVYWYYLQGWLGIEPFVYGISGHQWDDIYDQAVRLQQERRDSVDAIFIFAGTNDYNHNVPLGTFYTETMKETNHYGEIVTRKFRTMNISDSTFCGRINKVMSFLKDHFPEQQIIMMTPLHRGFATFSDTNVQPEESYCNAQGLFLESYINTLRQAADVWSVPVIDLYAKSGLYPLSDAHTRYFRNSETDRLHLNAEGNFRLAKTIQYQLNALPATFVKK